MGILAYIILDLIYLIMLTIVTIFLTLRLGKDVYDEAIQDECVNYILIIFLVSNIILAYYLL